MRLTCAKCGCLITYEPKRKGSKTFEYYHCANGKKVHECQVNVTENKILTTLGESVLESVHASSDRADELPVALNQAHDQAQAQKDLEANRCRRQLADLDVEESAFCKHLGKGNIDGETFRKQQDRIRAERRDLFDKLQDAQKQIDGAYLITAERILELARNLRNQWKHSRASRSEISWPSWFRTRSSMAKPSDMT
jgi:hypothetical protein